MTFSEFFNEVRLQQIELVFDATLQRQPTRLSNEAMFHLPLIAITILMLSKGHSKPQVDEIGQLVGDCFERTFTGFRGSAQHLGWSASLRVRTVQALAFLEQARLVEIEGQTKKISATTLGRSVIDLALAIKGDLAYNLVMAGRAYRNIRSERQLVLLAQ